jgi:hypothetical protein
MALAKDRLILERAGCDLVAKGAQAKTFFAGAIVCISALGFATPGATALGLKAIGRCEEFADNALGNDGDVDVKVKRGIFRYDNSADADAITDADIESVCYIVDDCTVAKTNGGGTRSVAGRIMDVDSAGVWVALGFGPYVSADGGVLAANNGNDFANKATTFANLKQAATDAATGVAEIATQAEVLAGVDDTRFVTPAKLAAATYQKLGAPAFVIGAEAANAINVGIQLKDAAGANLAVRASVRAYLSDDANGDSIVAAAPSAGVAIGADGLLIPMVANKAFNLTSEANGHIDITISEAGVKQLFLILVMPDGRLVPSAAIAFA